METTKITFEFKSGRKLIVAMEMDEENSMFKATTEFDPPVPEAEQIEMLQNVSKIGSALHFII